METYKIKITAIIINLIIGILTIFAVYFTDTILWIGIGFAFNLINIAIVMELLEINSQTKPKTKRLI